MSINWGRSSIQRHKFIKLATIVNFMDNITIKVESARTNRTELTIKYLWLKHYRKTTPTSLIGSMIQTNSKFIESFSWLISNDDYQKFNVIVMPPKPLDFFRWLSVAHSILNYTDYYQLSRIRVQQSRIGSNRVRCIRLMRHISLSRTTPFKRGVRENLSNLCRKGKDLR